VAELHFGTTLKPTKLELLTAWMGGQRWYASKGTAPSLTRIDAWRLGDPEGEVGIETLLVLDDSDPLAPVVYQVPLTYRGAPVGGLEHALVGTMEHGVLGSRWIYDGTHDPAYAAQLLALVRGLVPVESSFESGAVDERYAGSPATSWAEDLTFRGSTVLSGEQSNTSIIIDAVDGSGTARPVIIKVFRMLAAGENPDVVLQTALRDAHCERVPAVVGSVRGEWPLAAYAEGSGATLGGGGTFHLAFAQEFLPGVEDAWRVASRAVEAGADFSEPARALGAATAQVHVELARTLGTTPTTVETGSAIVDGMRARFEAAVAEVEALAEFAPHVERVLAAAVDARWPAMQRIHGDYHLGQVLHSVARGWVLLDFEGEPMRPLAERSLPDQWIRDVAGLLRSFDYCGGSLELSSGTSAREWVRSAQEAFLDGYAAASGDDPRHHEALLIAFELDKAMYEVVYEARNRPDWVTIPLEAIARLTGTATLTESTTSTTTSTAKENT
jgi:predicted trehalose synthase